MKAIEAFFSPFAYGLTTALVTAPGTATLPILAMLKLRKISWPLFDTDVTCSAMYATPVAVAVKRNVFGSEDVLVVENASSSTAAGSTSLRLPTNLNAPLMGLVALA